MTNIHPTAIIEPGATLAEGVSVGPYCVVGGKAVLQAGVVLHSHVVVGGDTQIGEGTQVFPFASLGLAPQDLKYHGEASRLVIGRNNMIREHVTMNPGTEGGGMLTQVGDSCLFMVGAHVAHDCRIGNHVILANNATLAGHVAADDHVIVGGMSAIHQFVRIGAHAIIGGMTGVEHDVIPYGSVIGERGYLAGLNLVGLKRRGFDRDTIHALRHAYKTLFDTREHTLAERTASIAQQHGGIKEVAELVSFIQHKGSRALCTPRMHGAPEEDAAVS